MIGQTTDTLPISDAQDAVRCQCKRAHTGSICCSFRFSVQEGSSGLDHARILPRASDVKEPFSFAIRSYRLDYKTMTNETLQTGVEWNRENSSAFYFD
jgi:hypothetical protein